MENTMILDNIIADDDCDNLIERTEIFMGNEMSPPWNYVYYDFPQNDPVSSVGNKIVDRYLEKYPEINLTFNKWYVERFRIKRFNPGKFYDSWHSENGVQVPRILAILIYLSDHNCGTEFYNNTVVQSKKGRALVFPAFWTHTHRGQPCPDNKSRYVMSAYVTLTEETA